MLSNVVGEKTFSVGWNKIISHFPKAAAPSPMK